MTNYRKKAYSREQRESWKRGFLFGLSRNKEKHNYFKNKNVQFKKSKSSQLNKNGNKQSSLLDSIKRYRERNLGALVHNGKYYDTNFIDRPHEITKETIEDARQEMFEGENVPDDVVADQYVRYMRRKYGVFDGKTGKFLGLIGKNGTIE